MLFYETTREADRAREILEGGFTLRSDSACGTTDFPLLPCYSSFVRFLIVSNFVFVIVILFPLVDRFNLIYAFSILLTYCTYFLTDVGVVQCIVDVLFRTVVCRSLSLSYRGGVTRERVRVAIACQFSRYGACAPPFSPVVVVAAVCCVCLRVVVVIVTGVSRVSRRRTALRR